MIDKLKRVIFSSQETLSRRIFMLSCTIGTVALIAVFLISLLSGQGMVISGGLAIGAIVVAILAIYAMKSNRLLIASTILVLITNGLVLPVGYILGGGAYSGAPVWFILGIVFVFIMFRGALFWVYMALTVGTFAIATYVGAIHPDWVVPLPAEYGIYLDTFIATAVVGVVCGALIKFQNIVLEQEITRVKSQRDEIEKLSETQNRFFSSMSHEIRTPISTIIGLNEMNMREKNLPMEVAENTLNIQNASRMLLSLINDLLDMSKIQSEKMEIVPTEYDTSRMLSDITNLHWNRAMEKELRFDIEVGENIPPMLYGDETRIKQIITNLLTNAIKYTEEGSVTLRFGGEYVGEDKFILTAEVEDTGMGIRREDMEYLFDSFRRVEGESTRNIEGTGLGLAISKQLTDLMDGSLTVDSIYTKGSTFRVEIPQGVVSTDAVNFRKPGVFSGVQKEYQQTFEAPEAAILVVDDNDMNRIVCQKLLRDTKVQVDTAKSGQECLELTSTKHYDAILMDHEMPGMDGIETLRKLRQQTDGLCRGTPVIALTANAGSDREAFYIEQGFSAYLSKPIQSRQLETLLIASLPADLVEKNEVLEENETIHTRDVVSKIPYIITTDSICDLSEDMLRENDIMMMPYYIETGRGRFRDIEEIDADNLRQFIGSGEGEVHSEPAPVSEYEEFFGEALTEARFVLHLSSSKLVSGAFQNATEAAKSFGNVMIMDSGQISSGLGMMALKASELFKSGMRLEETLEELERYKKKVSLNYLVPSLEKVNTKYRTGLASKLVIDVLNMEPVFTMKRGGLRIRRFLFGYVRTTTDQFVHNCLKKRSAINTERLFVTFSGCTNEQRERVLRQIEKSVKFDEVIVNRSSASSFANMGPDAFGITYELKDDA